MPTRNIKMIKTLANGLGDLINKIVLIGGNALDLYITDTAASESHPTDDVDAVVGVPSMLEFRTFELELEARGFERRDEEAEFTKTWLYEGIKFNITPMHTDQIGFHNQWYEEGVFHSRPHTVAENISIRIFSPVYFMASKIEAFINRGNQDFRMSEDFQDIVFLLANRPEIAKEIKQGFYQVRDYIQTHFRHFLSNPDLEEGICYALPYGLEEDGAEAIKAIMERIVEKEYSFL